MGGRRGGGGSLRCDVLFGGERLEQETHYILTGAVSNRLRQVVALYLLCRMHAQQYGLPASP